MLYHGRKNIHLYSQLYHHSPFSFFLILLFFLSSYFSFGFSLPSPSFYLILQSIYWADIKWIGVELPYHHYIHSLLCIFISHLASSRSFFNNKLHFFYSILFYSFLRRKVKWVLDTFSSYLSDSLLLQQLSELHKSIIKRHKKGS